MSEHEYWGYDWALKKFKRKAGRAERDIPISYTRLGWRNCIDGCKHRLPDEVTERMAKPHPGALTLTGPLERLRIVESRHRCTRKQECIKRRQEIYRQAFAARDEFDFFASWHQRKKRRQAWDETIAEFEDEPCPFYEPEESKP